MNNTKSAIFVPVDGAHHLRMLGFEEPCVAVWRLPVNDIIIGDYDEIWLKGLNGSLEKSLMLAPTWEQAFKYIRSLGYSGEVYSTAYGYVWIICKSADNPNQNISGGTSVKDSETSGPNRGGGWDTFEAARADCFEQLLLLCYKDKRNTNHLYTQD